jgi:hypothetical protein
MSMFNGGRCDMCEAPTDLCDCIGMMWPTRTPEEEAACLLEAEQMGRVMGRHFFQEMVDLIAQPDES